MFFQYPVSGDTHLWVMEQFEWAADMGLLRADTPLVTLDRSFFTAPSGDAQKTAAALLADFKRILRIPEAQIDLLPLDRLKAEYRYDPTSAVQVAGTWQGDAGTALIRYDPEDMRALPVSFLATMGHEVMHHVLRGLPELPPGGEEAEELSTDLMCICMGLGLLQMAGAEQSGWQGYLRQTTRAHALAAFLLARGMDLKAVTALLPPRSAGLVNKALRHLQKDRESLRRLQELAPKRAEG
ncbi:hypothetical protein ACSBLW_09910 [Thioclava sp. FR2]|uniref:hypothetical protein n=1 Tax=Thioclava sp. FR2 TaxID=3445780 RepID=UPI003EBF978C